MNDWKYDIFVDTLRLVVWCFKPVDSHLASDFSINLPCPGLAQLLQDATKPENASPAPSTSQMAQL